MLELKFSLISDRGQSLQQKEIASATLALKEIRSLKADGEKISLTQPLNPRGSLKIHITFSPKGLFINEVT